MTPKHKTVTVKAVGLLKRGRRGVDFIRSYGPSCDFATEEEARIILAHWKERGDQIVDCVITVQLKKGKKA